MSNAVNDIMVKFHGDASDLLGALSRVTFGMQSFGLRTSGIFSAMRVAAPVAGAAVAIALGGTAVKAFASFDSAMVQSLAIMGDVSDSMKKRMGDAAEELSHHVTFSATELAGAYYSLASAGMNASQSIAALPQVAKFAQAGMMSVDNAAELAAGGLNAMGLASKDPQENLKQLTRVTDVLTLANNKGIGTLQDYATALTTRSAAAGKIYGQSLETVTAALVAFGQQHVLGATAGTQFSIVLRDLTTKALVNADAFKKYGVEVYDAQGHVNNFADIIGQLEHAMAGMSEEQEKAILRELGFTDRTISATLALLGNAQAMKDFQKAAQDAGGTVDAVANNQLKSFSAQLKLMKNNLNTFAIDLGRDLAPVVLRALNGISNWFDTHGSQLKQLWADALPYVFAFGRGVQTVFQAIYDGMAWIIDHKAALIGVFIILAAAFIALTGPIGVLGLIVTGATLAIGFLKNLGISIDNAKLAMAGFSIVVAGFVIAVAGPFGWLLGAMAIVIGAIVLFSGNWQKLFNALPVPVQQAMFTAATYLDTFAQKLADFENYVGGKLNDIMGMGIAKGLNKLGKLIGFDPGLEAPSLFPTDAKPTHNFADSLQPYMNNIGSNYSGDPADTQGPGDLKALRDMQDALEQARKDAEALNLDLKDTGLGVLPDLTGAADKAGAALQRSFHMTELVRAFIAGGTEMVDKLKQFQSVSDALWPSVVAEAASQGVQLTEDDRAQWEIRLNNGTNFLDQMIAEVEAAAARQKQVARDVAQAWIQGGSYMAAQVQSNAIMMDGMWADQVAQAKAAGIQLVEADRAVWEAKVNDGKKYIDILLSQQQALKDKELKLHQEMIDAFIRGGAQMVADAQAVRTKLDADWLVFVAAAKAAGIEVVEADRTMWEQRMLNGTSAVDYLIAKEKELADARKKAHDDAISAVNELGSMLELAVQRQHDQQVAAQKAQFDAMIQGLEDQKDALKSASDARMAALQAEHDNAIRLSEEMTKALIAPLQAQIDAINATQVADQFAEIAKQMLITYDPREMDKLLKQRRKLEQDQQKKGLEDQIKNLQDRSKSDQDAINARFDAQKKAEDAALKSSIASLDAQIKAAKAAQDKISTDFDAAAKVRELLLEGDVAKMAALLDKFVPEWRTAGLSYGQQLIDGIRASGAEAYIAGILSQVAAAKSATGSPAATAPTANDQLLDGLAIKRLVDGGAPQAAIDMQRASYLQIYGVPSPYAKGGVFRSSTVGQFGEYPGASTNPEVAAPQSVLEESFRKVLSEFGMGGSNVTIIIDGKTLDERVDYRIVKSEQNSSRSANMSGINA